MSYDLDQPEGLLGCKLAFEGVGDAVTILNGPTGCKFYPSSVSETTYRNRPAGQYTYNPYLFKKRFFFSQPRIPCTHMDGNDYIMGTRGRLSEAVEAVMPLSPGVICVLNSPGASLIGEDLSLTIDPNVPVVKTESPEPSMSMGRGFQNGMLALLNAMKDNMCPNQNKKKHEGINLIGISAWHLGWEDSISDLTALLGMCGISVNMTVGVGWTASDIRESCGSRLNVIIHEEYGKDIAEWYHDNFGIPYVNAGCPIGFDALEGWIAAICKALKKEPSNALNEIRKRRTRAANVLSVMASSRRLVRGATFSVSAEGSITYSITRFLYEYLGMVPVAVNTGLDGTWKERIDNFLDETGVVVEDDVFDVPCDIMVSDGHMIASAMQRGIAYGGVAVSRPGMHEIDVLDRPVVGLLGTMRLLDSVLNALERIDWSR